MRILLSAYACDPNRGSENGNGWNWASTLARQGHEVWVLSSYEGRTSSAREERARRALEYPSLRIVDLDVTRRARFLKRGWPGVYVKYVLWLRASLRQARRLHAQEQFDLAHHVTWGSLLWGCPLWRLPIPFVFGPVGGGQVTPPSLRQYFKTTWWTEVIRTLIVRKLLPFLPAPRRSVRSAVLVLATNRDTLSLVERMGAIRARLTIDTATPPQFLGQGDQVLRAEERLLLTDDRLSLIWIGRLLPRKGLPLALEALRRVPLDLGWHLTIVGDGPLGSLLPGWISDLGMSDRVEWVGQLEWSDVQAVYMRSSAMLFTSLRDSAGNQLYEAMAQGLPVVALDHQGASDILPDDASIKVTVGDADETADRLARAIAMLAADPEMRASMSRAARDFAQRSTWESRVTEVYEELQMILAGKRNASPS